ncbi:MAG: hypothetical protein MJK04_20490 [Psychrosphaera sp.]|nr:hypothetical protein [Psychrosphaera sp.]
MGGDQTPQDQDPQQVLDALNDILSSKSFAKAQRLKALLNYVVHAKLNNKTDHINGYTIAIEVFERPASFDPQTDTVVRVTAARLRTRLKEYYESHDPKVKIVLPVRSYVPEFIFDDPIEDEPPQQIPQQLSQQLPQQRPPILSTKNQLFAIVAMVCITIISVVLILSQTDEQSLDAIERNVIKLEHQVANQSVQLAEKYFDKEDYVSYRVHNCSIQDCSLNEFKAIEKIITDNYIKIIGPSDSIYLPYDKIKGMEYNRESGLFTIWM